MHHQVQEFGDLGLERLGLGRRGGIGGHYLARWMSKESGKTDIATLFGWQVLWPPPFQNRASVATLPDYQ
jgi:hypothetical protein